MFRSRRGSILQIALTVAVALSSAIGLSIAFMLANSAANAVRSPLVAASGGYAYPVASVACSEPLAPVHSPRTSLTALAAQPAPLGVRTSMRDPLLMAAKHTYTFEPVGLSADTASPAPYPRE